MSEDSPVRAAGVFLGVLVLVLGSFLVAGPFLSQKPSPAINTSVYNNFGFEQKDGTWATLWRNNGQVYEITLRYHPLQLENIPISGNISTLFNQRNISISFDPNLLENYKFVALAAGELGTNLKRAMGREPVFTCTTSNTSAEACLGIEPATCESVDSPVILLDPLGSASVSYQENCIVLGGQDLELIRAVDRMLYTWYGIMKR